VLSEDSPFRDPWGHDLDVQENCEFCDRGMVPRFGGQVVGNECPSCRDDMKRLHAAGKLRMDGWAMEVVKIEEA
jgi:hypothetical protein